MRTGTTSIFTTIFRGLDEETLDTFRQVAEMRTYPPQTYLCNQGAIEHTFYIIVKGRVAITQQLEDGEERLLSVVGEKEYFGELALMDDTPRMANCVTLTEATVLEITEVVFDEVLSSSPVVAYTLMRHILNMLRSSEKLSIADLTAKNLELQEAYQELQAAQDDLVEKERLEKELEIAANLQRTLLPNKLPEFPDYKFAAHLKPARRVGGDFYDAIELDDEHVGLLLADVADKSVQAALFMAVARTLFMVEGKRSLSPAEVALMVHRGLMALAPNADIFVTAFYGVLHRPSGRLSYVIAGHERPLLLRHGTGLEQLLGRGRFIGMIDQLDLKEYEFDLQAGDRLLIFSDGVPDATNNQGQQYGYERMADFLMAHQDLSAHELIDQLVANILEWRHEAPAFDDLTMLAVEVNSDHGSIPPSA